MKRMGKVVATAVILVAAALLFLSDGGTVSAQKKKGKVKFDPEIKAAVKSLQNARARVKFAIENEVFGERGPIEAKVIDELKVALKHVDLAIKHAKRAQLFDKG